MVKVLIAYQDKVFAKALKDRLCAWHDVEICNDGTQVLERCRTSAPQVLVIDLEMPGLDGISVLHILKESGHEMDILAIGGCVLSGYNQQQLVKLGVCQYMLKPCTADAAAFCTQEIIGMNHEENTADERKNANVLMAIGIQTNLIGYSYLCAAIAMLRENPCLQMTKAVYPAIAEQYSVTSCSVERAMRHSIHKAWKKRDDAIWKQFFPCAQNGVVPCPTNGYFVSRMAACASARKIV